MSINITASIPKMYMNNKIRVYRDYDGRYKGVTLFTKVLRVAFFSFVLVAFTIGYFKYNPIVKTVEAEKIITQDNLTPKIEELKKDIVNTIQACESKGHSEEDGIIVFDSNKQMSIGTLQFQKKTVQYYYKSLYNKEISPKEAVIIALDDSKAEQLAYDIIFSSNAKGWSNWYNCSKKHAIESKIAIIRSLEK